MKIKKEQNLVESLTVPKRGYVRLVFPPLKTLIGTGKTFSTQEPTGEKLNGWG